MDATQKQLEEKLANLLKQTAEVAAQIQAEEQGSGTRTGQLFFPSHDPIAAMREVFAR